MNQPLKELPNFWKLWELTSKKHIMISPNQMLSQLLPSTTKKIELDKQLLDLKHKMKDFKTNSIHWTNKSEPNQLLLKLHQENSKETNNFGIKLKLYAEPSPTNTIMLLQPEETNFNWLLNWKRWSKQDSIKLKMKTTKETKESLAKLDLFSYSLIIKK